jgi:PleD family two-component response regulator
MILVVEDEEGALCQVSTALQRAGYQVTVARDGAAALARVAEATPDLIIAAVVLPEMDGLELLRRLRADAATAAIPIIMLAAPHSDADLVTCLDLGADDCLIHPFEMTELLLRVRARMDRPLLPRELLRQDPQTGLLGARAFEEEVERELSRARGRGAGRGCLAYLELDELPRHWVPPGIRARKEIARQAAALLQVDAGPLEIAGRETDARFGLLLPRQSAGAARERLEQLSRRIAAHPFAAGGERVYLTPVIGHAPLSPRISSAQLRQQALAAIDSARGQLHRGSGPYRPALAVHAKAPARDRLISWVAPWKAARTPS